MKPSLQPCATLKKFTRENLAYKPFQGYPEKPLILSFPNF